MLGEWGGEEEEEETGVSSQTNQCKQGDVCRPHAVRSPGLRDEGGKGGRKAGRRGPASVTEN